MLNQIMKINFMDSLKTFQNSDLMGDMYTAY